MHRAVTGHAGTKAIFLSTSEPPRADTNASGIDVIECWATRGIPVVPIEGGDPTVGSESPMPGPGETRFGISRLPGRGPREPIPASKSPAEVPGMHTTDTVDYITVVSGEVWLVLDDGAEIHLTQGDTVVQNGTRHAWDNRSHTPCVLSFVMIGAERRS